MSSSRSSPSEVVSNKCIMVADIGTLSVKCFLFDEKLNVIYSNLNKVMLVQPAENVCEVLPDDLYCALKSGILDCIYKCPENSKIACFGLTTQMNSIVLWNNKTDRPCSNFILWSDNRPVQKTNMLNTTRFLFSSKITSKLAAFFLNNPYLNSINSYKIEMTQVTGRLAALVEKQREVMRPTELLIATQYCTFDTWALKKISKNNVHLTDITNASSSGITELHKGNWCEFSCNLFAIPTRILPRIQNSCHFFDFLGPDFNPSPFTIPITSDVGNNQAACLAECADFIGDIVICLGVGTFINANVGKKPEYSKSGEGFPQWGYKSRTKKLFLLYYPIHTSGLALDKAQELGFFKNYSDIDTILNQTEHKEYRYNSVHCLPGYGLNRSFNTVNSLNKTLSGISSTALPFNGILNVEPSTRSEDVVTAIIKTILFSVKLKFEAIKTDFEALNIKINKIKVTGGLSQSDAFCQHLSNFLDLPIERSAFSAQSAAVGAAFLAGLCTHLFNSLDDIRHFRKEVETFKPKPNAERYERELKAWLETTRCYTNLI